MQCTGKKRYTKKLAETLKNRLYDKRGLILRIYQCPECNTWHLTHTEKWWHQKKYHNQSYNERRITTKGRKKSRDLQT